MKKTLASRYEALCEGREDTTFYKDLSALESGQEPTPAHDVINSPSHYTSGGIETIDFIEAKCLDYHLGNVVKYVSRAGLKGAKAEDLKKARWYLDRAIERLQ